MSELKHRRSKYEPLTRISAFNVFMEEQVVSLNC